jgi:SSS family solute:Na+ symporter
MSVNLVFILGLILYIAVMILIGSLCTRGGKAKGENYLTGGGRLPFYLIFATLAASFIGTGSSVGATANGLRFGFGASAFGLGTALGLLLLVFSINKQHIREKGFKTLAEEAQYLYGGRKEVRYLFASMVMLSQTVALGTHITGAATYLSYVTGIDLIYAKLFAVLAFGIYLLIGGYLAVVWTDLIQLIILLGGFVTIVIILIPLAGGWTEIQNTLNATGKAGNLSFYGMKTMGIMPCLAIMASVFLTQNGSTVVRLRIYTSKDDKTAKKSLIMAAVTAFLFSFIPAFIGMAAYTIATKEGISTIFERPDYTFSFIATYVLGPVLGLLFLIAGLSATLSSGDSDTIASVTIFVEDIIPMIKKKRVGEESISKVSRYATFVILIFAFLSTLLASDIMGYITNVMGAITPPVAIALLVGNMWKRSTWQGAIYSVAIGTAAGVLYLFIPPLKALTGSIFGGPAIPVGILSLCLIIAVSLLTPEESATEDERMKKVVQTRTGE